MDLNDLLRSEEIDPRNVLVFRHRPHEPELNKVLPWLAAERPDVFNGYQQTQGTRLEHVMQSMVGTGYVASFIGREAGKATFVGLYAIRGSRQLSLEEFWRVPAYVEMKKFGLTGFTGKDGQRSKLWFDLVLLSTYASWKGKLVVQWPPPERSWWRRAHRNEMSVLAIHEASVFDAAMPEWDEIALPWEHLKVLPKTWKTALSQWRGIYYIVDTSDGKAYVGSAYGRDNLLGRWQNYAGRGHGGNRLLRERNPRDFQFAILQRVSPDMDAADVVRLENAWKERLRTRVPHGLNDN